MKTELLYLEDCYKKEFTAKVIEQGEGFVVLDQTLFYPAGGGQPSDTGFIDSLKVTNVRKDDNKVVHFISGDINKKEVKCEIDWDIRYKHMRMHTAQHVLSAIVLDRYGASTAGNQIGEGSSRIDFYPLKINSDILDSLKKEFDFVTDKKLNVKKYFSSRKEVLDSVEEKRRNLFARVPETVKNIRVVEIEGFDRCPCAGTHVDNTSEIGYINIVKVDNKGKDTVRVVFELI